MAHQESFLKLEGVCAAVQAAYEDFKEAPTKKKATEIRKYLMDLSKLCVITRKDILAASKELKTERKKSPKRSASPKTKSADMPKAEAEKSPVDEPSAAATPSEPPKAPKKRRIAQK